MAGGSAFMIARQLIRQAMGLREAEPTAEQHAKLRAHVADQGGFSYLSGSSRPVVVTVRG